MNPSYTLLSATVPVPSEPKAVAIAFLLHNQEVLG